MVARMETTAAASLRAGLFTAAVLLLLPAPPFSAAAGSSCTRSCGNISIPFPFGVEPGCYYAAGFNLTCDRSHRLLIGDGTVQVLGISVPNATVRVNSTRVAFTRHDGGGGGHGRTATGTWGGGLPRDGPYYLSSEATNSVAVLGCGVRVDVRGGVHDHLLGSCTAVCPLVAAPEDGGGGGAGVGSRTRRGCTGVGCCQANIVPISSFYNIQIFELNASSSSDSSEYYVYIVDGVFDYTNKARPQALPAMLDWVINNSTCSANASAPACRSEHSFCQNSTAVGHGGYLCRCSDGYHGNPYIHDGCQDIDECGSSDNHFCYGDCKNTEGSFVCQCPAGHKGNAYVPGGCKDINECAEPAAYPCYGSCLNFRGSFHCECPNGTYGNPFIKGGCITIKKSFTGLSIGLGIGGGTSLLLLALGAPFIARKMKQRKVQKMKDRFFMQNHGLLLQQLISQSQRSDIGGRMIISLREIEKATNKFDASHEVGGGGHGVVYKGLLDLQVVAIKKSKIVVQREIDDFINEVAILSQINHRNVVKLLGCCLETEVPLLVYEFISNGTLENHLHVEGPLSLSWVDRFRIALEISKALAYLHSAASTPILHRDIKSSNILLDDNLTAKVSDFGASKYIPIDQNGVTTAVQGTIGYLDPMYFYKGRLTDKSDIYSFGVLLVELITRKKPTVYRSSDGESIVSHFASLLAEGNLVDIIDPQIMEEDDGQVHEVAELAAMCTKLNGEDRPTMREVEMTLEYLRVKKSSRRTTIQYLNGLP